MQALDETKLVDDLGGVREQLGNPLAALAVLLPIPFDTEDFAKPIGANQAWQVERQRLAVPCVQQRLAVKRVHLADPAMHEQEDHPLAFAGKCVCPARVGSAVRPAGASPPNPQRPSVGRCVAKFASGATSPMVCRQ